MSEPSFALSLAALSDLGQIFVTTTYELEGDDFLCILAYDIMTLLELAKKLAASIPQQIHFHCYKKQ